MVYGICIKFKHINNEPSMLLRTHFLENECVSLYFTWHLFVVDWDIVLLNRFVSSLYKQYSFRFFFSPWAVSQCYLCLHRFATTVCDACIICIYSHFMHNHQCVAFSLAGDDLKLVFSRLILISIVHEYFKSLIRYVS